MKKFLSMVMVVAVFCTMTVTLNCMTVSASFENLCKWQYYDAQNKRLYTSNNDGQLGGKYFTQSSTATGTVSYYENGIEDISNNPLLDIATTKYTSNYYEAVPASKPVINFSFKVYVPEGTQTKSRSVYFSLAKKDTTKAQPYANSTYGMIKFIITNSSANSTGAVSQNSASDLNKSVACTTSTWHQINIRAFKNFNGKLVFGMYSDGYLLSVAHATATEIVVDDIGIYQVYFNNADTTYIKDIRVDAEDYDPTYAPTLTDSVPDVAYLNELQFNTIGVNATTNALTVTGYGENTANLATSSQTTGHYKSGSTYRNINYSLADDALKVDLTPSATTSETHALIQDLKKDLTSYFPSDTTKYMQMSYDIKIPSGTEDSQRRQSWRIGNDGVTKYNYCYEMQSNIVNGKLQFTNENTYKGAKSTLKSASFDIQSDKWYKIIYLLGITNETDYVIHNQGYVYDAENNTTAKIYDQVVNVPKLKAGVDKIILSQQQTYIITPAVQSATPISTYYDNITTRISKLNFAYYYSNLTDLIPQAPIELTENHGVATVIGRNKAGVGTQRVIIAGYNKTNELISYGISNTVSDANTAIDT